MTFSNHHDVLIAGGGPVGLLLACELRLAGCAVLVLERDGTPDTVLKRAPFGLRGLSVPTIEAFDRRGLLEPLRTRVDAATIVAAAPWMKDARRPGGHFAGIDFFRDQVDETRWPYRSAEAPGPMAAELDSIDAILTTRAEQLGVTIRRGCGVSDVVAGEDGVIVHAGAETFSGSWLVGCDGARSVVRKAAGFGFAGTEPEFTGYFAQVELADPDRLAPGHHDTAHGTYIYEENGTIRMVEFDGGACHRAEPVTRAHVEAVLRRISGADVTLTALGRATTWTDRAFLAREYRRGRVLLAGDAAHIHSPLGGQGLNLGLGDAMNLGWKLARTIRGEAPAGLLDSYARERRPLAERILDWSRAQVALMRPDRGAQALRAIVGDLVATRDGATYFAERVWGVGVRYELDGDHPLVGRSAPDFMLADGTRVNERLRSGRAILLSFGEDDALARLAQRCPDAVAHFAGDSGDWPELGAVLIRPDGFVAWAGDRAFDAADAAQALSRWLGCD